MIKNFVDENFDTEGTEFDDWIPQDWKENIPVYQKIKVNQSIFSKFRTLFCL